MPVHTLRSLRMARSRFIRSLTAQPMTRRWIPSAVSRDNRRSEATEHTVASEVVIDLTRQIKDGQPSLQVRQESPDSPKHRQPEQTGQEGLAGLLCQKTVYSRP